MFGLKRRVCELGRWFSPKEVKSKFVWLQVFYCFGRGSEVFEKPNWCMFFVDIVSNIDTCMLHNNLFETMNGEN